MTATAAALPAGRLESMPEADYHALPALGSTDIKNLLRSPAHYRASKQRPLEGDALNFGTLFHECVLDPAAWAKRAVAPKLDRRTKAGKAAAKEWAERVEAEGLSEVDAEDKATCEAMRDSAMQHELVRAILGKMTHQELSCFWETDGVPCKARFDGVIEGLVLDLKTTTDATPGAFRNAVARYGYHTQAAHYSTGAEAATGVWPDYAIVAVEKAPPFACAVYMLDEEALNVGNLLRRRALEIWKECAEWDRWPAYPNVTQVVTLPRWAAEEQ